MAIINSLLLSFPDLFEEEGKEKYDYLNVLPSDDLKLSGAHLVNISKPESPFYDIRFFLEKFFCKENNALANEIYNKIEELRKTYPEVLILNPLTSLQVAEYSLMQEEVSNNEISNQDFEKNLLKAYLKINARNIKDEQIKESLNNYAGEDKLAALTILSTLAYYDLTNYNIHDIVLSQFVKAVYLFKFMSETAIFKPILKKFLAEHYCDNWTEYLQKLLPLVFTVVTKENKFTHTDHIVNEGDHYEDSCNFIDTQIFDINDDFSRNLDFIVLRGKPLYKFQEGKYRVVSDLFLAEKLYNSLYFSLSTINKEIPKELRVKDFRGTFCLQFTENYLFYSTLRSIYENKYKQFSGEDIVSQYGIDSEPDYYIRNGSKIFLFENKDVLLNAEIKTSYNFQMVESALMDKFYYEEKNGKRSNKAVLQLINNIENILTNSLVFDEKVNSKSARVYPILITYYNIFNTPGINYWLNKWHNQELESLEQKGLVVKNIRPLTIINIDTLIVYSDLLKHKKIHLENLIDDYHKLSNLKIKDPISEKDLKEKYMERFMPFDVFVHNYCNNKKLQARPSIFIDMGEKMIKNAADNN